MTCPSVSDSGLVCNKLDSFEAHITLSHRNLAEEREWPISKEDRKRWKPVEESLDKTVEPVV